MPDPAPRPHQCSGCRHWLKNKYQPVWGDCTAPRRRHHVYCYGYGMETHARYGCVLWEGRLPTAREGTR